MSQISRTPVESHPAVRTSRRLDVSRWSGILFVVIGLPGFALGNPTSPYLDSSDDYVSAYADGAGQAPFGRVLGLLSVIALLWALARLRVAFEGEGGLPGAVLPMAGTLYAATWVGSIAATAATYTAVDHSDSFGGFEVVPETAFVIDLLADGFNWANLVAASVLVWGLALAGRRSGHLPGWMCWIGIVLVPLLPIGWMLFMVPVLVFLVWFAAVVAIVPAPRVEGA
jgi:hypothetical protein